MLASGGPAAADVTAAPIPGQESGRVDGGEPDDSALRKVGRAVLFIPRALFELGFQPVRGSIYVAERFKLPRRYREWFYNDEQTFGIAPWAWLESGEGFSFGGKIDLGRSTDYHARGFAGAGGARSHADGIDVGGEIPNPISRMANVETVENTFPIRYLFRRRLRDSGGAGRWRGGVGMELAIVPHDAPDGGLHYVISGKGSRFPMSEGLGSGMPGAPNSYIRMRDCQWSGRAPQKVEDAGASLESVDWGVFPLMGSDGLYIRWNGGGGYGDPLTRPSELVQRDVRDGLVSNAAAHDIYGVTLDAGGAVDSSATDLRRKSLRSDRLRPNG